MSVYKPKGSEIFVYDFEWRGHRFSGSTGVKSKREAEQIERNKRAAVRAAADAKSERAVGPIDLDAACDRYWVAIGQYAKSASQIEWLINYLLEHFGESTLLS